MDGYPFRIQRGEMDKVVANFVFVFLFLIGVVRANAEDADTAGQEAAGIVAGLKQVQGAKLIYNDKSGLLEIRDGDRKVVDTLSSGTVGKVVDVEGQEYRVSFGKDGWDHCSVLVKPGPAMQKPVTVDVLGRKVVLSPEASLLATIEKKDRVFYEPSLCGQVYYIEGNREFGGEVSRRAVIQKESVKLAKPVSPSGDGIGTIDPAAAYKEDMESAGNSVKSAFLTVLGLPDKQATPKANVYRLGDGSAKTTKTAGTPSAEAGRPSASN